MSQYPTRTLEKLQAMIGRRFGRWLVIALSHRKPIAKGYAYWFFCRCDCGTERPVLEGNLKGGLTVSCGCWNDEQRRTPRKHGKTKTKEYRTWQHMIARCYRPTVEKYPDYGGRGIQVCDRWQGEGGFANFLADIGPAPGPEYQIDRRDNDGNYCPENCRWVTKKEQMRNKRTNRFLEFDGRRLTVAEWGEVIGISPLYIWGRIFRMGWSVEEALTIKPKKGFKREGFGPRKGVRDAAQTPTAAISSEGAPHGASKS